MIGCDGFDRADLARRLDSVSVRDDELDFETFQETIQPDDPRSR